MRAWTAKAGLGVLWDFVLSPTKIAEAERARRLGAALQASGQFLKAAEAYADCLAQYPRRRGVWVQKGNCLKDGGDYQGARAAYDEALKLNGAEPDIFVQLGNLARNMGDRDRSVDFYRRALDFEPDYAPAISAMNALSPLSVQRRRDETVVAPAGRVRALDVSDLLLFLLENTRVTGIQRVQCALIQELLKSDRPAKVELVFLDGLDRQLRTVDVAETLDLLTTVATRNSSQAEIVRKVKKISAISAPITLKTGDVFLSFGAFWNLGAYSDLLGDLRRQNVRVGVYVYDVIPLTHPQFFTPATQREFAARFDETMRLFDFGLAISEHSAREAARMVQERLGRSLAFRAVPLAHELPAIAEPGVRTKNTAKLPRRYALCVCTLEVRKNHLLLVETWSRLAQKYGEDLPHLVLVGKWGWNIEPLRERLEIEQYVGGKIIKVEDASDVDLADIYEGCLFTLFPSFAEGWGLPVGESLCHAKPCIASNATSIPEVGGVFVRYIDPFDLNGAMGEIERALFDTPYLEAWTRDVRDNFVARRWEDVAEDFLYKIEAAAFGAKHVEILPSLERQLG